MLKNAPLKEVIFELHWELDFIAQQQLSVDNGFEEAVMNFRNICFPQFEHFQLLIPSGMPYPLLNNQVTHRFFKEKDKHPIFQIGPGVFTVNDNNKNYIWNDFRALIHNGVKYLQESYKKELVPSKVELRFIDAVNCSVFGQQSKFNFLREHLNVNAESYPFVNGELVDINFTKRFLIEKDSYLNIKVSTGRDKKLGEDVIIWHTFINNKERITWSEMEQWIDFAHSQCSNTFKKMISPQLHEYFS